MQKQGTLRTATFLKDVREKVRDLVAKGLPEGWEVELKQGLWLKKGDVVHGCSWDRQVVWFPDAAPGKSVDTEKAIVLHTQIEGKGWVDSMARGFIAIAEGKVTADGRPA